MPEKDIKNEKDDNSIKKDLKLMPEEIKYSLYGYIMKGLSIVSFSIVPLNILLSENINYDHAIYMLGISTVTYLLGHSSHQYDSNKQTYALLKNIETKLSEFERNQPKEQKTIDNYTSGRPRDITKLGIEKL